MTSSASANTSAPAKPNSIPRSQKIKIIRDTILAENITAEELSLPYTYDIIAICTAIRSFPIKITPTKLTIIITLASLPLTQQQLLALTQCEQSSLSHILTELRDQRFITKQIKTPASESYFTLTDQGKQLFNLFHQHYFKAVDTLSHLQKIH